MPTSTKICLASSPLKHLPLSVSLAMFFLTPSLSTSWLALRAGSKYAHPSPLVYILVSGVCPFIPWLAASGTRVLRGQFFVILLSRWCECSALIWIRRGVSGNTCLLESAIDFRSVYHNVSLGYIPKKGGGLQPAVQNQPLGRLGWETSWWLTAVFPVGYWCLWPANHQM